jgi:hypothetical protein
MRSSVLIEKSALVVADIYRNVSSVMFKSIDEPFRSNGDCSEYDRCHFTGEEVQQGSHQQSRQP